MVPLRIGPVYLDRSFKKVRQAATKQPIALTGSEYLIFELLVESGGRVVDREQLCLRALNRRWNGPNDRSIDQIIGSLRHKLPRDVDGGHMVRSVRTQGYFVAVDREQFA